MEKILINKLKMVRVLMFICVTSVFMGILSCNDEFLDRKPLTSISDADVWGDLNLIEAFVNDIYGDVPHGFDTNIADITDECYRPNNTNTVVYNSGGLNGSNMGAVNYWSRYYGIITKANVFLDNIDNVEIKFIDPADQTKFDRIKGEVIFLRAYAYFKLASFHGGVPLITKPFKLDDNFFVTRDSYDDVMELVLNELDYSASLLPLRYDAANSGRITKGAALSIKSRALLYMASPLWNPNNDRNKWQKAADAAKAVIDLNEYQLVSDYSSIFDIQDDSERIFWQKFDNKVVARHYLEQSWFPNGSAGRGHYHILQNAIDDFEMTSGLLPNEEPNYNSQNPYVNRDPRFYDIVLYNGAPWQDREIETFIPRGDDSMEASSNPESGSRTGYFVRKFVKEDIRNPTANNVSNTPWIYCRYAEILLNYAEANFYLGNENIAREYLNKVRSRPSVNMPDVYNTGQDLEKRIQNERRIELFMEQHRWFDVRRWKIAEITNNEDARRAIINKNSETGELTFSYTVFEERIFPEHYYLAPIPQSEIDKNSNLTQNPGY